MNKLKKALQAKLNMLLCKHEYKEYATRTQGTSNVTRKQYYLRCKNCGKETKTKLFEVDLD